MPQEMIINVEPEWNDMRIDRLLSLLYEEITRSYIQKLIEKEHVLVNGKPVTKSGYKVKEGEMISFLLPDPEPLDIQPENIPLDVIYEDDDVILVNKGKNMVVHPAPGHYSGTLVNGLMYHCNGNLSGINGIMRPGIVHRIDRNTTGIIVACKNDKAHQYLSEQLKVHSITRKYHAIVYGNLKEDTGRIEAPIGRHPIDRKKMAINYRNGKPAATNYRVLERFNHRFTYIECSLETGRTHQIRVHMASIGHPLLGDDVYGPANCPFSLEGQVLHAKILGFVHPSTGEYIEFDSSLPPYFEKLLERLRKL